MPKKTDPHYREEDMVDEALHLADWGPDKSDEYLRRMVEGALYYLRDKKKKLAKDKKMFEDALREVNNDLATVKHQERVLRRIPRDKAWTKIKVSKDEQDLHEMLMGRKRDRK